ncbi:MULTISPECIES: FxsA family protein [Mycobacterium]|uniref:Membrane protein FxsA n=1 Tax=Mycobacterium kiyosense TaxID=2871094 RepID=A0A9P3QB47_9MYCO|nr:MULTISPECIES: FxsA family protein [Mycobacterium]BDB42302.1 membrane protein FxsA [Mycobacterium kiyosense]BDE14424.1 membrane protein FxsA [Mycobacterium sp. 20KCMC460]GLB84934.1 membrane protein FxsA [Mycobacterium kiyosense]GLB92024.1 membrane protein FxsA [Mycobacterium kiyosense]GLB98087.1 membrane protein FxsA [Mycobacterium kiyosense]
MLGRLLLVYAVVELMVTIGLAAAIGVGWTVLILLTTFLVGVVVGAPMGGLQISRQFRQLRSGAQEPRSALTDGALTTLATGLVMVPGLATTLLGVLLLMPPVRAVASPGLATVAWRVFERRVPLITDITDGRDRRDYIDGEVIDVHDGWAADPPPLPSTPIVYDQPHRAP